MIIAIASHKGGVGKTTTCAALAFLLAKAKPVLLIDMDPQSNATSIFPPEVDGPGLAELLAGEAKLADCVRPSMLPDISILPATSALGAVESDLARRDDAGLPAIMAAIRKAAKAAGGDVVIDTAPSLAPLALAAMATATHVVVPAATNSGFALDGLERTLEACQEVRSIMRRPRIVPMILATLHAARTASCRAILGTLEEQHGAALIPRTIPRGVAVEQAEIMRRPLPDVFPKNPASKAYKSVLDYIISHGGDARGD